MKILEYIVTVTGPIFTKVTLDRQLLVKHPYTKFEGDNSNVVVGARLQTE